jgi:hypothetical protein
VRNNVFGPATIADITYPPNRDSKGRLVTIRASDSGRTDRTNLLNVDIVNNALNGETIMGCELPDNVVFYVNNSP